MHGVEQIALESAARRNSLKRLAVVVLPAGLITISLFTAMHQLVAVDNFTPPEQTVYDLKPYMEAEAGEPPERADPRPIKPDPIDPPPQPPRLVKDIS